MTGKWQPVTNCLSEHILKLQSSAFKTNDGSEHFLKELVKTVRVNVDPERHIHLVLENDDNNRILRKTLAPKKKSVVFVDE